MGKQGIEIKKRKAKFNYECLDELVSGLSLVGLEAKSIKLGNAGIAEAHCYIQEGEVWITGMYVAEYKQSGGYGHDPYRKRKLLLTRKQINKLDKALKVRGNTIVPVKMFVNNKGLIKLKIALAKGKKKYNKRELIKNKDMQRDVDRALKR